MEIINFCKEYLSEINNIIEYYKNKLQRDKLNEYKIPNSVNNFIEYARDKHKKHKCLWAERKREYYWKYNKDNFHNNIWTTCIFEHAEYLISSSWINYNLLRLSEVKRVISIEFHYCKIYISQNVARFLDDLLKEVLINYIEELDKKIKEAYKFKEQKIIDLYELSIPRIYLKIEDDQCVLINTLCTSDRVTCLVKFQLQV